MHVTICCIISRACVNFLSTIKVKIILLVICVSMLCGAWSLPSTMPLKFCVFPTFRCAQPKYCSLPNSANGQLATNMEILNCDMVTGFLLVNPTCLLNYKNHGLLAQHVLKSVLACLPCWLGGLLALASPPLSF